MADDLKDNRDAVEDIALTDEKIASKDAELQKIEHQDEFDPHAPFPDDFGDEQQLTIRAVIVGCLLGAVVAASNLYLGLKTGFTFGPALFGAILGFSILKPLSRLPMPAWIGQTPFGPKENCTVQTAATAAGGLGIIFVSGVPALYRLGLLSASPTDDVFRLLTLTLVSAFYGLFFGVPLRRYFVIKMKLVFPTPFASAVTIRSLHDGVSGAVNGRKKTMALLVAFVLAMAWVVAGFFFPGVLHDWHIFYWMADGGAKGAIQAENWHWILEWTPAFIGAGMITGVNPSYSLLGGSFLAWALIGPQIVATGIAQGKYTGNVNGTNLDEWSYFGSLPRHGIPTPRYWLLWPGVSMMLFYSFAEMGMNAPAIYTSLKTGITELYNTIFRRGQTTAAVDDQDPARPEDQVPTWGWVLGVAVSSIVTIIVLNRQFGVGVGEVILSILLAFVFAFIGLQSAGDTDINPVSAVAKSSQLIFGGITKSQGIDVSSARTVNLIAGTVAGAAASQSVDMVGDLKTGYLLNATPKSQFIAQIFGAFVSAFLGVGLFILFTKAYPCILTGDDGCAFGAPSVAAWAAVAQALASDSNPIPRESGYTSLGFGAAAVIAVVLKYYVKPEYRPYIPNFNAIGIAFILPSNVYSIAMFIGSTISWVWEKRWPSHFEMFAWAVAAGLISGEGIGGLVQAIMQIGGIDGEKYGYATWCPKDPATGVPAYCG